MVKIDDLKKTFSTLVNIDSPSLHEKQLAVHIKGMFEELGIYFMEDGSAHETGSDTGNLYAFVKGGGKKLPILLSAHMDTVMPAYGKKAVFEKDGTVRSDKTSVLGADDLAGITEIYHAVRYLKENYIIHRDVEILFTTGEELYGKGAKAFDYGIIKSRNAYVLDLSGRIGDVAYAAPTIISFEVAIKGRAAHAGFYPENGINAVAAAAKAIAGLPQGRIDEDTTANIGMISGGDGINIVSEKCVVKGEIRSLKHERAQELAEAYRKEFAEIAREFGASSEWNETVDIRAYETGLGSAAVNEYKDAARQADVEVNCLKTFGGSDNNIFALHGIEGIVVAVSMHDVHSCEEYANVYEMSAATRILVNLMADAPCFK